MQNRRASESAARHKISSDELRGDFSVLAPFFFANLCTRKLQSLSECGITIAYTKFGSAKGQNNYGKHPGII